ncbi:MAG: hypothetical protein HOO93_10850 [Methyloglobulus sp.]|nr:hypothetical protein [Methyloglobulus sp.]
MKTISEILRAKHLPMDNRAASKDTTSPGKTLIDVTELAQNRYGFQVPVLLSQLAYQRCVAVASGQANQSETLWLFKVLALAKYAIRHCESGATSAGFKVQVNDHKLEPQLETLTALVYPGAELLPVLLIKHASEAAACGVDRLMDDLKTKVCSVKEAV